MVTNPRRLGLFILGLYVTPPETPCPSTPMMSASKPPPYIEVSLNQEETEAILYINCQSDGKSTRWSKVKEEGSEQAKRVWLGKLGCLLKVHGNITCKWFYSPVGTSTDLLLSPDIFNNPWSYRIADFPENYKLFVKERQTEGNSYPQKDHYLCGGSLPFPNPPLLCTTLLTISFQVESVIIGRPKNSIHIYIGYLRMLKGSTILASANTAIQAGHRNKSTKSFHSPHARKPPKG